MKPTIDSLLNNIYTFSVLISCKAPNINCNKVNKLQNVVLKYDDERITKCVNIANELKKD